MFLAKKEETQKGEEAKEKVISTLKNFFSSYKIILLSSGTTILLLLFGLIFMLPSCLTECGQADKTNKTQGGLESKWPVEFPDVVPHSNMLLYDVNHDNESDVILAFKQNARSAFQSTTNVSVLVAIDGKTGLVFRNLQLDFLAFKIYIGVQDQSNISCFVISPSGIVAKISLGVEAISWKIRPCSKIHSVLVTKDVDEDKVSDLLIVCSWVSVTDTPISGIALVSGADGKLIGSKIRYQLGQQPSSFLMQHQNAKNETCILFGIQRKGKSTVLAVRLRRLLEIATGTRNKVNLVSENPLVVARNVRADQRPAYDDISGDGVKDIGFVLEHGIISFIDGATLSLRKTIDARSGNILR